MQQRSFIAENYKFGFNGMEVDKEITGHKTHLNFGARLFDSRLGRWLSADPLSFVYPSWSTYNGHENNPILYIDPTGKGAKVSIKQNTAGQTYLEVKATIYVYSANPHVLGSIHHYAQEMQRELDNNYNNAHFSTNFTEQGKDVQARVSLKFNIRVVVAGNNGTVSDAQQLKDSRVLDDRSVNIINLNYRPGEQQSSTYGNSGTWSVNENSPTNTRAHEVAHLFGIQFELSNGKYDDHIEHGPNYPGWALTNSADPNNRITYVDIKHMNFGAGFGNTPDNPSGLATKFSPGGMAIGFTYGVKYVGSENNNVISGDSEHIERDCADYYDTPQKEE